MRNYRKTPKDFKDRAPKPPFRGSGTITLVEFQQRNPERVNVFIDEQFAFSVADIVAMSQNLKKGDLLSEEQVSELQAEDSYRKALATALNQVAMRPHSENEVLQFLRRKYPLADADALRRAVARLKELHYLNDEQFATFWIENRANHSPRGSNLLKQELMKKGVPRDIIAAAIESFQQEQQDDLAEEDEAESDGLTLEERQALELARKKARAYAAGSYQDFYRKLGGVLLRRGYDYSTVSKAVKQVWQELKNEPADDIEE